MRERTAADATSDAEAPPLTGGRDDGPPAGAAYEAQALFDDLPVPAWLFDSHTLRILDVNSAAVAWYGYSRADFLALTLRELRPAEELAAFERAHLDAQHTPLQRGRFRHRWRDGTVRDVEVTTRDLVVGGRPARLAVVHDVTDRLAAERAAAAAREAADRTQERLRFALAAARLGSWELDLASGVLTASEQARANFGRSGDERFDLADLRACVVPDDRAAMEQAMAAAVAGRGDFASEYRVRWPDGSEHWILAQGVATYDEHGRAAGLAGVNQEISARKLGEAERERLLASERLARAEAEAANAAKAQFLATMSHELRTPLNAIGGYAQLMEMGLRGPVTPEQQDDLARIQYSQAHLLGLINAVLSYAKLEAGRVHYHTVEVPVGEALAAARGLVAPQAQAKGLALDLVHADEPVTARADAEKLRQIVLNLLTNALKFTPAGGRVVMRYAAAPPLSDGRPAVEVRVSDTGVGIAADKLATVFEPFVQVGRTLTSPEEGVGLGLAISRDLARGMGGELTARSVVGEGSTFVLVLPAA